jgi:glyoxylase-like metal-dependent hydrolase (beta-lactamase superfamily II)
MIFRQVLHPATGCASYLFGCTGKAKLAVVDPHSEHIADYLALAEQAQSPIVAIFETHLHADHLSGVAELARRTGATAYLHEAATVDFPHADLRDGDQVELGNDYVRVLHTPGHTPDSVSLLVGDRVRAEDPWFVLTGDTLFVGDVGRPDLNEGGEPAKRRAATQLYDSLFQKLLPLPDSLEIYPGHFAGSACGRAMSGKPSSTIGFERRFNPSLQAPSREEFVALVLEGLPARPAQQDELVATNRRGGLVAVYEDASR